MSFNFDPQPGLQPLPFSTVAMHAPAPPHINNPVSNSFTYLKQNYWQGAVRIKDGNDLTGEAISGNFSNFVCSFWATNLFIPDVLPPVFNTNDYAMFFGIEGSYDLNINLGPSGDVPFTISNFLLRLEANGALGLYFLNSDSTALVGAWHGPPDTLGIDYQTDTYILPTGIWHHYIVSFEGATNRCQVACDRGGGPNWGGGIMDTSLGNFLFELTSFHPGTAPQGIWGGSTAGTPTSFTNPGSGFSNKLWRIQAPNSSSIDLAYFYFGVSARFFDLTIPGNLDYFVTSSLLPVNLGPAGSYVAPVGVNSNPLTCLVMHTGDATSLFGGPEIKPWDPNLYYGQGFVVSFNGKNYFSILAGNRNHQPDISPDEWWIFTPSISFQFPYNAATGTLWGGTLENAPTEPLTTGA